MGKILPKTRRQLRTSLVGSGEERLDPPRALVNVLRRLVGSGMDELEGGVGNEVEGTMEKR